MDGEHMRVEHTPTRARRVRGGVAAAVGLLLAVTASVFPTSSASADTITVPFQDHLGCVAADGYAATSTPIFSKQGGSGAVANGAQIQFYSPSVTSAYPMQPGVFGAVANPTGSFGYGSFGQEGYGSTSYYSGANGIGFSSVDAGARGTLTVTMPFAQRVQFTVGGIDAPSGLEVTATGPSGAVPAQSQAKSTAAGSATTRSVGGAAQIAGANQPAGTLDNVPQKAVDVWFDQPVQTLTIRVVGDGSNTPSDGGFLLTPPLGCQSGSVQSADATAGATDVQPTPDGDADVVYTVPLTTTVTNASPTDGMVLLPTVRSDLGARVAALGGTVDAIEETASSDPACAVPTDALPSGHLLGSTAALAPGATCTQTATATVTLPQDAAARTISVTATLASSASDTYSRVKGTAGSTLTFPGVPAALTLEQTGVDRALPTTAVERSFTVHSTGPGVARAATIAIDPGGFPATACTIDDAPTDCDALTGGTPVTLGALAAGAERVVTIRGTIPRGTPAGTVYTVTASVASPSDPTGAHSASGTTTVIAPSTLRITAPADRSTIVDRTPSVRGTGAQPGAEVRITHDGLTVCTTTARSDGAWSCTLADDLPYGSVTLVARSWYGGISSDHAGVRLTIARPSAGEGAGPGGTPPVSTPPPAPPVAGSGATGGAGSGSGSGSGSGGAGGSSGGGQGAGSSDASGSDAGTTGDTTPDDDSADTADGSAGTGGGDGSSAGTGAGAEGGTDDGPLAMNLRFGTQRIVPGTAADMRGTLGPNASGATVAITFEARITPGMVYRNVNIEVDDSPLDCAVATSSFSCMIPLDPGQQADVDVRVYADPVNAPDTAVQQISLASNRASQSNAMTVTTVVAKGATEASELADQITTFNATEFPGAMVPLLAMLLFALAATGVGRRASSGPAAAASASPPGAGPPEPSRASSPTAAPTDQTAAPTAAPRGPTTDPPSGSNR
ncbi:hypothetical protein Q7F20_13675 [Curtobacterium sp. A7_M15]|uniref:hypothetical protein n=1 Tax=Curtobacterium sp. A7_M15 TaxID=3065241 RepID=UPI002737901A|nr:hypothetical protein [Curtobacterium sp. A7_M15]MDP4334424.1 hypothetical protein [Curtobacterium sp. A7_M15]